MECLLEGEHWVGVASAMPERPEGIPGYVARVAAGRDDAGPLLLDRRHSLSARCCPASREGGGRC